MLSLADLSQAIAAYERGTASLDEFVDWFHASSQGKFGEDADLLEACLDIEMALSRLSYEGISEAEFRVVLGTAAVSKDNRLQPEGLGFLTKH